MGCQNFLIGVVFYLKVEAITDGGICFFFFSDVKVEKCVFVFYLPQITKNWNAEIVHCSRARRFNCFVLNFAAKEILMWANSHEYH